MDSHSEICSQLPVWAPEPSRMLNYMGLRECSHANRHREPIKITWLHFSPLPKGTAGSLTKLHTNLSLKHNWISHRFPAVPTALRDMRFKFEDIASFFKAQENISKSRKKTLLVYFPEKKGNNKNLSFRYFGRGGFVCFFVWVFLIWVFVFVCRFFVFFFVNFLFIHVLCEKADFIRCHIGCKEAQNCVANNSQLLSL